MARLVGFSRCQKACWVGCRSPCSFRSIGRDGLWTTRSFLYIRPAHLCNAVASSRKHQESTPGPKGIAGPTGSLCLFRCMCGRVTSPRFAIMPSHRHEGPCVEHLATRTDFCVLLSPLTGGCSDDFHGSVAPQGWYSIGVDSTLIEIILAYLSCASCQSGPRRLGFTAACDWVSRHLMTNAELDTRLEHLGDSLKAGLLRSPRSIFIVAQEEIFFQAPVASAQPSRAGSA